MARPKKVLDEKDINQMKVLARCHCPDSEIAAFMGIGESTLKRRFGPLLKVQREAGRANVRRWQMDLAQKGNPALLIWLGKQLLGQREPRQDFQVTKVEPFVVEIEGESTKTILGVNTGDQVGTREVN